jgi:hypothetical protein
VQYRQKLRTFRGLNASSRMLITEGLLLQLFIPASLCLVGVPRTQRTLKRWALRGENAPLKPVDECSIRQIRQVYRLAIRNFDLGGTCLSRSLMLWALLLRRGVKSEIRVGLRTRKGKIEGHAWVECSGQPLNEDPATIATYTVFAERMSFDLWP